MWGSRLAAKRLEMFGMAQCLQLTAYLGINRFRRPTKLPQPNPWTYLIRPSCLFASLTVSNALSKLLVNWFPTRDEQSLHLQ